ncbi:hypothetical protein KC669_03250 [Candidatus Dojkabacteria bacterium]|uniref:Uncharacterized protein n=1 Tax=Candidatus Dojkabacteria bacterium TaxID=2099670 RepID=A0A955RLS5_9BACT|nr:hypothetical protein [Candidatus Dojkabacteria bacterium]
MTAKTSARNALYGMVLSMVIGLVLLLLFIFSLIGDKLNSNSQSVTDIVIQDLNTNTSVVEVLPVDYQDKIIRDTSTLNLGQSYLLNSRFATTKGTNFICSNQTEDCEFFEVVTNSNHIYYISIQSELKLSKIIGQIKEEKVGDMNMYNEVLELTNSGETVVRQMWGCINNIFCVSSGEMYIDSLESNKEEKNLFITFVNSLRIS